LTEAQEFSLAELTALSGLSEPELRELVDYGALVPTNPAASSWVFAGQSLTTVRTACRLRSGFELELTGVALVLTLLRQIEELETQLGSVRARLPGG
jgi:hypothetical protein